MGSEVGVHCMVIFRENIKIETSKYRVISYAGSVPDGDWDKIVDKGMAKTFYTMYESTNQRIVAKKIKAKKG